jgi:tRNA 2-thiouridine synthesizing protein E
MTTQHEEILSRLDAISRRLDAIERRQRFGEEMMEELMPVGKLVMNSAATHLAEWDERGLFEMLGVGRRAMLRILESYSREDAEYLADAVVGILATVRNVTQPGMLQVANQASDVLSQDGVEPVGIFGAMRKAAKDEDIKRGLGVMLEVMRAVGRAQDTAGGGEGAPALPSTPRKPAAQPAEAPAAQAPAAKAPAKAAPAQAAPPPPEAAADETKVVHWEGHDFDPNGFLIDPSTWTPELAQKIAAGLGITLTDEHMHVIEWVRDDYASAGASPNVRRVANGSGVGTEAMYRLFPPTPGKTCAMIAGVPKPVGCV